MLHASVPSGKENMVASVYLLAIDNAMLRASECSVFNRPGNEKGVRRL
jgi:hypothetical protein